jgi:hypothetical protein
MRAAIVLPSLLFLVTLHPSQVAAGPAVHQAPYKIVLSRQGLRAGDRVEMQLLPPVPPDVRVLWPDFAGKTNRIYSAVYRAPYVIPPGTPPVTIGVGISGGLLRTSASTEITLIPSSVPGSENCLGPDQSFSTTSGTIVPDYTFVDELPELIHRVEMQYPRSAQARGVEDTLMVMVLVCRTGHVLDAYAPYSYERIGDLHPIERDAKLVEAALAAARQFVFKPGLKSGQAMATWLGVPMSFRID